MEDTVTYKAYTKEFDEVLHHSEVSGPVRSDMGALDALAEQGRPLPFSGTEVTTRPDEPVTFLLDLSGSQRGRPANTLRRALEIVGDKFCASGVPFRVLGFTTTHFKGGPVRQKWRADGCPAQPGRLNALRHIVFHEPSEDWASNRAGLRALLREEIFKENIDGEALLWAEERAPEGGRIVLVSDASPVDQDTLSVNPARYLIDHEIEVLSALADRGREVVALRNDHEGYFKDSEWPTLAVDNHNLIEMVRGLLWAALSPDAPKAAPDGRKHSPAIPPEEGFNSCHLT